MTKRIQDVYCQIWPFNERRREHGMTVWVDANEEELADIEGVEKVWNCRGSQFYVWVDPRYGAEVVAGEIRRVFTTKIPDIFQEAFGE